MEQMDADGSGEVDFQEFYEWWIERRQRGDYDLHSEAVAMFQSVDVDSGGTLDVDEVRQLGAMLGYMFTEKELQEAMSSMDDDGSGEVDFQEFYDWWLARKRSGDCDLHSEAVKMFQAVDADGGGTLDIEEVREVGVRLDFDFHQSELETAFRQMDVDGSGAVDFGEFFKWWSGKSQRF